MNKNIAYICIDIMSRREYKRRFSRENHRYANQHVHGGGLFSSAKAFGRQLLGKTVKRASTKVAENSAGATPAGGQEIVKLLQQQSQGPSPKNGFTTEERIQRLLRGGQVR